MLTIKQKNVWDKFELIKVFFFIKIYHNTNLLSVQIFILLRGHSNENIDMHFLADLDSLSCILSNGT